MTRRDSGGRLARFSLPEVLPLRRVLLRLVGAVAVMLAVLIGVAIAGMVVTAQEYRDGEQLAVARQSAANQLLIDLLNAETGNRGYTLTGRGDYLRPFTDARARYATDLTQLKSLLANEPGLGQRIDAADQAAKRWFQEAVDLVRLRRLGREREAIARINNGSARRLFGDFRSAQAAILDEVSRLRNHSVANADRRRTITLAAICAAAVLALAMIAIAARQLWRRVGGPAALLAEGVGRVASGEFTEPVPEAPTAVRELAELTEGFNEMQRQLIDERQAVAAAARREAAQQTERRLWETVQSGLMPSSLPSLAGLRVAARYQPAEPALLIGGDFYDAKLLRDGRLAVVVGDLAGHGAAAAARAAGLRFGWRTLLEVDPEPAAVVAALNAQAGGPEERVEGLFASMLYALIDPSGAVSYTAAGHPPPLLLVDDACTALNLGPGGPLLGVFDDAEWPVSHLEIPPGGTLVLYTDGLVEARRGLDLFGPERACAVLMDERRAALEARVERLIEAARRHDDKHLRDDVVVLAVERIAEVVPVPAEVAADPSREVAPAS
jgi:serine phosphatase RsbU (regulator of sigma subunit)/CHASE3 domain sensor protein